MGKIPRLETQWYTPRSVTLKQASVPRTMDQSYFSFHDVTSLPHSVQAVTRNATHSDWNHDLLLDMSLRMGRGRTCLGRCILGLESL